MALRIADIPSDDRPRERLGRVGVSGLSDAELIALVVRTGGAGRSALDLGRELLAGHGSLARLATATLEELSRSSAMGGAKAASLLAALELGRRSAHRTDPQVRISGPEDIVRAVLPSISNGRREEVFVVALNVAGRLLRVERLTVGAADHGLAPPRDVVACVLRHDGAAFALAHTHPSGNPAPSPQDVDATRRIADAAAATGLRFVDHVVVAGQRWASLRALGYLGEPAVQ